MKLTKINGLPIIDATKPLNLRVTPIDVAHAERKKPDCCAFARACARQIHVKEARVHLARVYIRTNTKHWTRYVTSLAARAEIIAFDRGGVFAPGSFELRPIWRSEKIGTKRPSGPRLSNRKPRTAPRILRNVRASPSNS